MPPQLGTVANPSSLAKFLLNLIQTCTPDALIDTRVLMDTNALPNANDVAQWLVDYNSANGNPYQNPIAIPTSTVPHAGGDVLSTCCTNHHTHARRANL